MSVRLETAAGEVLAEIETSAADPRPAVIRWGGGVFVPRSDVYQEARMTRVKQAIPTVLWRELQGHYRPLAPRSHALWRALISGEWAEYDLIRAQMQQHLDALDAARKAEPTKEASDRGWDAFLEGE